MKGFRHRTLSAATADELRRRILAGELPGGSQLRQDALAEAFGISRIPLREALVQLEAEGLVRIVPHRGAVVAQLSPDEVEELFDLRALVEPDLLARSAPRLTADDFAALEAVLADYADALRTGHVGRWGELNTRFHGLLYSRAGRPRSLALVTNLLHASDRLTRLQLSLADGGLARAEAEHAELLALCRQGEIAAAQGLLRRHIEAAARSLNDALRRADGREPA